MKVGLVVPQFGINATKENLITFMQLAEKEDFESLWVYDRMLYPLNPQPPYPGPSDKKEWPEDFKNVLDPSTTLAFIAANTTKVNLGTCIIDMVFHNPITLAKEFTTIDILSEGRTICGFGIGWSKDEYLAANIPYEKRGERANEILQAMKKVWTEDIVEFNENFYKIPKSIIGPKPIQKPHPKILLGGFSPKTFERMTQYGDGYIGVLAGSFAFEYFNNSIKMFNDY
jgi:probable F420-dependent oxidoreductase